MYQLLGALTSPVPPRMFLQLPNRPCWLRHSRQCQLAQESRPGKLGSQGCRLFGDVLGSAGRHIHFVLFSTALTLMHHCSLISLVSVVEHDLQCFPNLHNLFDQSVCWCNRDVCVNHRLKGSIIGTAVLQFIICVQPHISRGIGATWMHVSGVGIVE